MFGADSRAHIKDVHRVSRSYGHADAMIAEEEDYGVSRYTPEEFYEDDFGYGYEDHDDAYEVYDDEDYFFDDEEAYYEDDDIPRELEEAADQMEEAYVNYAESRQKMRELANARGFYPVVALAPGGGGKGFPMAAKGGSGGKGRRKGKG